MLQRFLRRKAIEALARGLRIPERYIGPAADAANKFIERVILPGLLSEAWKETVQMQGWKTILGGLIKTAGAGALAAVSTQLPDILQGIATGGTKLGMVVGILLTLGGDVLQKIGLGHKLDKNTEAIKAQ